VNGYHVFLRRYRSVERNSSFCYLFTARAMLALQALYRLLATAIPSVRLYVCPSVRPSVRLSVTRRYCVKTTARSTVQFAPLDIKMCLVL